MPALPRSDDPGHLCPHAFIAEAVDLRDIGTRPTVASGIAIPLPCSNERPLPTNCGTMETFMAQHFGPPTLLAARRLRDGIFFVRKRLSRGLPELLGAPRDGRGQSPLI